MKKSVKATVLNAVAKAALGTAKKAYIILTKYFGRAYSISTKVLV